MIAIYGVFHLDSSSVDEGPMLAMRDAILAPDSAQPVFTSHSRGFLGTCHYGTFSEDKPQPKLFSTGDSGSEITVISSARLDNREELAELLGIERARLEETTNNELILFSYQRWGKDCPARLLGDFVFAIWDEKKCSLFLARDHVGIKPLFFYRDGQRIVFSSEYRALFDNEYVPKKLSDEAVAIYLRSGELYHPRLTFVSAIKKLPPATIMTETCDGTSEYVYWRPEDAEAVEYKTTQEYADKLRELLESAIRVRLGDAAAVGAHLSGGLDSSTIAAIAASQLRGQQRTLHAFTWFPPGSHNVKSDEGLGIAERLAEDLGFRLHCTPFEATDMRDLLLNHNLARHDTVDLWYEHRVRDHARELGVSTILTGWGGDQLITNYGAIRYAETFWQGNVTATLRDIYSATRGRNFRWLHLLKISFAELLIRPLSILRSGGRKTTAKPDYMGVATSELEQIARRLPVPPVSKALSVRADQLAQYRSGHLLNRLESWAVSGQGVGIEYCHPLLDKRLIEYALGIPARLYRLRGASRFIFRFAIKDTVPEDIWQHALKAEPIRAELIVEKMRAALIVWRENNVGSLAESKHVDIGKLMILIDDVLAEPAALSAESAFRLLTAIKSIMVLNLSLPLKQNT
ncbi:MAG: asparagine synthase-related protein [Halioglobus sp.]